MLVVEGPPSDLSLQIPIQFSSEKIRLVLQQHITFRNNFRPRVSPYVRFSSPSSFQAVFSKKMGEQSEHKVSQSQDTSTRENRDADLSLEEDHVVKERHVMDNSPGANVGETENLDADLDEDHETDDFDDRERLFEDTIFDDLDDDDDEDDFDADLDESDSWEFYKKPKKDSDSVEKELETSSKSEPEPTPRPRGKFSYDPDALDYEDTSEDYFLSRKSASKGQAEDSDTGKLESPREPEIWDITKETAKAELKSKTDENNDETDK